MMTSAVVVNRDTLSITRYECAEKTIRRTHRCGPPEDDMGSVTPEQIRHILLYPPDHIACTESQSS